MTATFTNGRCPDNPHDAAAYYLNLGRLPIPLPPRYKRPVLEAWEKLRPTSEDLDQLFPVGVAKNVGLLLGEPSGGLVDVDLDTDEAVAAAAILLPPTGWVSGRAGRPKSHYWYVVDNPPPKATDKFLDLDRTDLLELRSTGGQTVVHPSLHKDTGERIVWHVFDEPASVDLRQLRGAVQAVAAAAILARHWPAKGGRHDARLALAGGLLRGGASEDFAADFVTAVCIAAHNEGIDDCAKVIEATIEKLKKGENVRGWPSLVELLGEDGSRVVNKVRAWLGILPTSPGASGKTESHQPKTPARPPEPYQPFPTEALPSPMRAFVEQAAAAIGCDPSFVALPALAVAASLIGNTRTIRIKKGWTEPCIVWTCIVGESGTLKSPAIHAAAGPVYRMQEELRNKFKDELKDHEQAEAAYAEKKREAKKGGREATQDEPEPPVAQRVVVSDITVEKVAAVLEDNPRGTLLLRDELAAWFGSFTRYKGGQGGTDVPAWLEMHRAGPLIVDRKTGDRPSLFVSRASVCVTGGIQPGTLARCLTADHLDAGLGARILPAWPPRPPKEWKEDEIAPEVAQAYETLLRALADLSFGENAQKEREPFSLRMTPEAKVVWVAYYNEWARRQAAVEGATAAVYAKLEGGAARLALLHHVITRVGARADDADPIEPESMSAGIALARWFAFESQRIYGALAESEDARQTRRLIDFIRQHGGQMTARRLQRANASRYRTTEDAEAALQQLVDAALALWIEQPTGPKGGCPTKVCTLKAYPTADKTDTTSDDDDEDNEGPGEGGPTQPPDTTPPTSGIPLENEGSVGFVGRRVEKTSKPFTLKATGSTPSEPEVVSASCFTRNEKNTPTWDQEIEVEEPQPTADKTDTTSPAGYLLVTDAEGLDTVRGALEETAVVGLDTETTGLDPRADRVRLLSLDCDTTDGGRFTYSIDCLAVDPRPLWEALSTRPLIGHNATFDLQFLAALGFEPAAPVHDTMLLSQMLHGSRKGRGFHGLGQTAERELGRPLDKTEQKSDWSGRLTASQLAYAAADAAVLLPLYEALAAKVKAAGMATTAAIEARCLPGMAWLSRCGTAFDRPAWEALARTAQDEVADLARRMDEAAPERPGRLMKDDAWNWASPQDVGEAFKALGIPLESTDDDALAGVQHPLAELLRQHRAASKRTGTYGLAWLKHVASDGRVYANWRQIGADSGRASCSDPNLQQIPRDARYRSCFIAPPGRVLIKADYSQVELRIAAKVTGDKAMSDAYARGEDLHVQTARLVLGVQDVTKAHRQLAKAINFGLLYGMGSKAFRVYAQSNYGVSMTDEDARQYREAFFNNYGGLRRWHRSITDGAVDTKTLTGRRRAGVTRFTEKLNTPVQGTGADGLKQALALLWERRAACPGAFPVLVVHDEIVVEADAAKAEAAKAWLTRAMVDGMAPLIAPVPCEVEVKVGRTWAGD